MSVISGTLKHHFLNFLTSRSAVTVLIGTVDYGIYVLTYILTCLCIRIKLQFSLLKGSYIYFLIFPNLLNGGIHKDRAPAKQSLLRWPCPLPSDRAIPVLWQNLESNV